MKGCTSYPWPTASRPCLCVGAAHSLLVNRLGSGSYHLPSLRWMSSRALLSHVLLCSRSAVDPIAAPHPGMLRSVPLRPDDPWSGMWGRCGPNSGALNDGLTFADPLSQGQYLVLSNEQDSCHARRPLPADVRLWAWIHGASQATPEHRKDPQTRTSHIESSARDASGDRVGWR
jgi:hypothetical protein